MLLRPWLPLAAALTVLGSCSCSCPRRDGTRRVDQEGEPVGSRPHARRSGPLRPAARPFAPSLAWRVVMRKPGSTGELAGEPSGLQYHRPRPGKPGEHETVPLPAAAVKVFTFEGQPRTVRVTDEQIAVDYGRSGVLFHRATGRAVRRYTLAQGWPARRPAAFGPPVPRRSWWEGMVGAVQASGCFYYGVRSCSGPGEVTFGDRTWRVRRPGRRELFKPFAPFETHSWSAILGRLNALSALQAGRRRYTTSRGLAGNIVTHLVAADDVLWAASLDVYDPSRNKWGVGGLSRYEPSDDRWRVVREIDGRSVRWVSLLQAAGDELWVGFRQGSGVAGDSLIYGMGSSLGCYRPRATRLVLARHKDGDWKTFSRPPIKDETSPASPPTEQPISLVKHGGSVFLLSEVRVPTSPSQLDRFWRRLSVLDLATGRWALVDTQKDLVARRIRALEAEKNELLLRSDRGVHRWDATARRFRFLDPRSPLLGRQPSAVVPVEDEVWVGFQGLPQVAGGGLLRYDERAGTWRLASPETLGIRCPVKQIVPLPGGEVWVLFKHRALWRPNGADPHLPPWRDLDCEGKSMGLRDVRRFVAGRWERPAIEGAPAPKHGWFSVEQLVAAGDRLFIRELDGVYARERGRWRLLAPGRIDGIRLIDGAALEILRNYDELGRYDLKSGKLTFEKADGYGNLPLEVLTRHPHGRVHAPGWRAPARPVLVARRGGWTVGPLGTAVTESSRAFWFADSRQLIRLDKARLTAGLPRRHQP